MPALLEKTCEKTAIKRKSLSETDGDNVVPQKKPASKMSWGYAKHNGPATWGNVAEAANGSSQSPINIVPGSAKYDASLADKPFQTTYDPSKVIKAFNTGSSVQVLYDSEGSSLEGGPLSNKYKVLQFHFHWGKTSDRGSEHTLDGKEFAAEAHIVHWNTEKYPDAATAMASPEGLCVLGMFIKAGSEHEGLKKLTDLLPSLTHSGDTAESGFNFDPSVMLPGDKSKYWTYSGSLTTPPCFESVTWVVFQEPIELSEEQLNLLRSMKTIKKDDPAPEDELGGCMHDNYRPPLPLGDRVLRASFE